MTAPTTLYPTYPTYPAYPALNTPPHPTPAGAAPRFAGRPQPANPPRRSKADSLRLVHRLKQGIVVSAIVAFSAFGGLVATRLPALGASSAPTSSSGTTTSSSSTSSGGFFGQGTSGSGVSSSSSSSNSSNSSSSSSASSITTTSAS